MKHDFYSGKYTVIFNERTGDLHAERHGEQWRSLVGDKLVLSMLQSTDAERKLLERAHKLLEEVEAYVDQDGPLAATFLQDAEWLRADIKTNAEEQTGT